MNFQYRPEILQTFPNIQAGVIFGQGMENGPSSELLQNEYLAEQEIVKNKIGETPLNELPSLAAWRAAFRQFGINPTKYRSASEALLRRLTKKGDIPSINSLVDIGNLISIRHAIPVAIFDTSKLNSGITVHFSSGKESFTPLFETESQNPEVGEVVFTDKTNMVVARRWCWRQSDESAARPETSSAIICTEAHHESAMDDVIKARDDLLSLLEKHVGGEFITGLVNSDTPNFEI